MALQKQVLVGFQAQTVLQDMYVSKVRRQLETQEKKKGKKAGKVNMDGKAKLLTQDDIMASVQEYEKARDDATVAETRKKVSRESYKGAVTIWKVRDDDRKSANRVLKQAWEKEVQPWEIERDSVKSDRRKPRWTKPKMQKMDKGVPKPKMADFEAGDDKDDDKDDEDNNDGSCEASDGDHMS
jgi:hypothetical protein